MGAGKAVVEPVVADSDEDGGTLKSKPVAGGGGLSVGNVTGVGGGDEAGLELGIGDSAGVAGGDEAGLGLGIGDSAGVAGGEVATVEDV